DIARCYHSGWTPAPDATHYTDESWQVAAEGILMGRHTCLYGLHTALGARMVDFGGWDMPVAYGSQIEEHQAVRRAAGVFDVSHMCIVDLSGARARELLGQLLSNDIGRLRSEGSALYSCLLNDAAGIIDDLLAYWLGQDRFRL